MIRPTVTITLTVEEAEAISFGLSDLLCWHSGYAAAREAISCCTSNDPMGIERTRDMNLKIKDALHKHEKESLK